MLPINFDDIPLRNKYNVVFVLNGLNTDEVQDPPFHKTWNQ